MKSRKNENKNNSVIQRYHRYTIRNILRYRIFGSNEYHFYKEKYVTKLVRFIQRHRHQPDYLNAKCSPETSTTILSWACENRLYEVVNVLLTCEGVELNAVTSPYYKLSTALSACFPGALDVNSGVQNRECLEIAALLVAQPGLNVDVSPLHRNHLSLLHAALIDGTHLSLEFAQILLRRREHALDSLVKSYAIAVYKGFAEIVDMILVGRDINLFDARILAERGLYSAVEVAASKGYLDIVASIVSHPQFVSLDNPDMVSALNAAILNRHSSVSHFLLHYVHVNAVDRDGMTPLMVAGLSGFDAIIYEILQDPHVAINATDKSGKSALMYAIIGGNHGAINALIGCQHLDFLQQDGDGRTVLMYAAQYGLSAVLREMLRRDSSMINVTDSAGNTAMMYAARNHKDPQDATIFQVLLDYQADTSIANDKCITAIMAAEDANLRGIAHLLKYHVYSQSHQETDDAPSAPVLLDDIAALNEAASIPPSFTRSSGLFARLAAIDDRTVALLKHSL